jgi:hypothetical protein
LKSDFRGEGFSLLLDQEQAAFIRKYVAELQEENAAVFVGAGLSRQAGFVDWAQLLEPIAKDLRLDVYRETNLVALAQFHVNESNNNRNELSQLLMDKFLDVRTPTENHRILARLPINTFWTTNYDRLLESALEQGGKVVDTKYTKKQLSRTRHGREVVVYKMHGDVEHASEAILTRNDYEDYHRKHAPFITALAGDLVSKTFLFLGFSFTDPNLDYVLSRVRINFSEDQRRHYCIMKKRSQARGEADDEFEYARQRQYLQISDLKRFNIATVLVDEYSQITDLLTAIEQRLKLHTIFISGSASDYGSWGKESTEQFLAHLASTLIERDYCISTGFGSGVGGAIVAGALERIYADKKRRIDGQLVMRPFPITADGAHADTFARYRQDLISAAGIAIFVMGNKEEGGKTIVASGVLEEFDLARKAGLFVIPIGSSGFAAKELWTRVVADLAHFFPFEEKLVRPFLEELGKSVSDPMQLLDPLLKFIVFLTKD